MTKTETQTIQNIINRLKGTNCGCHNDFSVEPLVKQLNASGVEAVSRLYLDSWIIPALELLLPGEQRNPELAQELSRK